MMTTTRPPSLLFLFFFAYILSQLFYSSSITNSYKLCDDERHDRPMIIMQQAPPKPSSKRAMEEEEEEEQRHLKIGSLSFPPFDYTRGDFPPFFIQRPKNLDQERKAWSKEGECRLSSKWLRDAAQAKTQQGGVCRGNSTTCPIMVHTELLLKRNESMVDFRKEQLPVLSFLKTQHPSVTLNILVNENDYKNPPKWLSVLMKHEQYGKRLRTELWNIETLNTDDDELSSDFLQTVKDAYKNLVVPASRSDVRRYTVMYHYGGLWFDTDTIFLADVRPLMGYDYVNVADKNKLNNAAIGTSSRHSEMMRRILEEVVNTYKHKNDGAYFRFGPYLFDQIQKDKTQPMPFGILSACLFDAWGGKAKNGVWWWNFFQQKMTKRNMQFFQDQTGPFTSHWHGAWTEEFKNNTIASVIHANLVRELQLDPTVFRPFEEVDWTPFKDFQRP